MARAPKNPAATPAAKDEAKPGPAAAAAPQELAASSLAAGSTPSPGAGAASAVSVAASGDAGASSAGEAAPSQSDAASNDKPEEELATPPEAAASGGSEAPQDPSPGARLFAEKLAQLVERQRPVFALTRDLAAAITLARPDEYDALRDAFAEARISLMDEGDAAFDALASARPADPVDETPVMIRARTKDGAPMWRGGVQWHGEWSSQEVTAAGALLVETDPGLECKPSEFEPAAPRGEGDA